MVLIILSSPFGKSIVFLIKTTENDAKDAADLDA
jgi:hypothetical protein